jgi:hypothetical protein
MPPPRGSVLLKHPPDPYENRAVEKKTTDWEEKSLNILSTVLLVGLGFAKSASVAGNSATLSRKRRIFSVEMASGT